MSKINKKARLGPPFSGAAPLVCVVCAVAQPLRGPARAGWRSLETFGVNPGGGQAVQVRTYACPQCSPDLGAEASIWDVFYANLLNVCYSSLKQMIKGEPRITKIAVYKAASNGFAVVIPVKMNDDGTADYMRT